VEVLVNEEEVEVVVGVSPPAGEDSPSPASIARCLRQTGALLEEEVEEGGGGSVNLLESEEEAGRKSCRKRG
jgi:hypothetical protein